MENGEKDNLFNSGAGSNLNSKSCPTLATPWTVAHQALLAVGFPRQAYWRGLPFPSPGHIPDPGIEPRPPALQEDSLLREDECTSLSVI